MKVYVHCGCHFLFFLMSEDNGDMDFIKGGLLQFVQGLSSRLSEDYALPVKMDNGDMVFIKGLNELLQLNLNKIGF